MHLEILVEDQSGKRMLDELIPRIIGPDHSFRVISYRGIGRIPKGLDKVADASMRKLLSQLPQLLCGYGRTFASYPEEYRVALVVVCDLDARCMKEFRAELRALLDVCAHRPETRFCIAIEEGEAWLLGDSQAVREAYPRAKDAVLASYVQDAICGTWEKLADAVHPGGAAKLRTQGWQAIGAEKSSWAASIAPRMDVERNVSPSFVYLRDTLRRLVSDT